MAAEFKMQEKRSTVASVDFTEAKGFHAQIVSNNDRTVTRLYCGDDDLWVYLTRHQQFALYAALHRSITGLDAVATGEDGFNILYSANCNSTFAQLGN